MQNNKRPSVHSLRNREVKGLTPCSAGKDCWSRSKLHSFGFLSEAAVQWSTVPSLCFCYKLRFVWQGASTRNRKVRTQQSRVDSHVVSLASEVSIFLKIRKWVSLHTSYLREGAHESCPPAYRVHSQKELHMRSREIPSVGISHLSTLPLTLLYGFKVFLSFKWMGGSCTLELTRMCVRMRIRVCACVYTCAYVCFCLSVTQISIYTIWIPLKFVSFTKYIEHRDDNKSLVCTPCAPGTSQGLWKLQLI